MRLVLAALAALAFGPALLAIGLEEGDALIACLSLPGALALLSPVR